MLKRREIRKAILATGRVKAVQSHLTGALTVEASNSQFPSVGALVAWLVAMFPTLELLWSKDSPLQVHVTFPDTASHTVNGVQAHLGHEAKLQALKVEAAQQGITVAALLAQRQQPTVTLPTEAETEAAQQAASLAALVDQRLAEAEGQQQQDSQQDQPSEAVQDQPSEAVQDQPSEAVQDQPQPQQGRGRGRGRQTA